MERESPGPGTDPSATSAGAAGQEPEQRAEARGSSYGRSARRRILFSVPFESPMTDADLARLRSELDLVTYITPKPGVSGASLGVVPLDFWSGLFLVRGNREGEWVLEGRTWGLPPDAVVHGWHVRAALAARELDRTVEIPRAERPRAPRTTSRRSR